MNSNPEQNPSTERPIGREVNRPSRVAKIAGTAIAALSTNPEHALYGRKKKLSSIESSYSMVERDDITAEFPPDALDLFEELNARLGIKITVGRE